MKYEFKVSEMAEEFGVHRNTIRNWINSGTLQAKEGPGRKYLMEFDDYRKLCEKFGRSPAEPPSEEVSHESEEEPIREEYPLGGMELGQARSSLYDDPQWADHCLTCGTCSGACPISGVDDLDPMTIVRMAFLGMDEELIACDWSWKCTLCGKCEDVCPAKIEIVQLMGRIRSSREKDLIPQPLNKGIVTCLERGNNLGIPKDDYLLLMSELGEELQEECPGFVTPIDVHGARILVTVNSKEPFSEPDSLKWWWKIFYAAKESWTLSSENWEGANWGAYINDEEAMKTVVGRIVDNMRRLKCEVLLFPESGHAYYATRFGLSKWYPDALKEFKVITPFDLLLQYLNEKKIQVDPSRHSQKTAYHDPCNYGRKSMKAFQQTYYNEGRQIIQTCCNEFVEMEPNRATNYCCGAGGGAWAMPFHEVRVFHGRMKARQIKESGAKLIIASCHNCRDQLKKSLNHEFQLEVEVKYLWELVADSLIVPQFVA